MRLILLLPVLLLMAGFAQANDKEREAKTPNKAQTADLKITQAGTGEATITSSPAGIDCGNRCRAEFKTNTSVTLTATAAPGSAFQRWGGACHGTAPTCTVTLKEAQNVTAITDLLPITLNISKTGPGTGSVISVPTGIDCGSVCSARFAPPLAEHPDDRDRQHGKSSESQAPDNSSGKDKSPDSDKNKDKDKNKDPNEDKEGPNRDNDQERPEDNDGKSQDDQDHHASKPAVVVTLTATPAPGSLFADWSGACSGTASTCTVTLDQSRYVTAQFTLLPVPLTIGKTGNGSGSVLSLQTGIDCGTACNAIYDWGSAVTLAATPATGSTFQGWSGACAGSAETCTVTLDQAQQVSADFALMKMTLTAAKTGTGTGALTSQPAGIDCGTTCSGSYDWGTQVTLTATPAADSTFHGWTGACTGSATSCTVTMDQHHNVTAEFAPAFKTLNLVKTGSGTGSVASAPAGIDCGATCRADFATGTAITLTATPATGSTFQGWFGACTGTAPTCTVTLDQAKTATAVFSVPAVTTYEYDANGNLTRITDPLGRIRQVQYDALNQPVRQLEPHPSLIGSTLGQIDTTYDSLGQIISVTDPRNLTTSYHTDSLGNRSQQTSPDTGITTAEHDAAGNRIIRTDARGQTATYRYDSLNRISQIADDDQTVTYTWDNCANGIGRLCSVSHANSTISYSYDSHGRIVQKSQSTGAAPLSVSHTYNAAGQRQQTTTPGGQTIDYQWSAGRLTALSINGQPVFSQIGYDPDGPINGWLWGNNQRHERFHDLAGRPVIVSLGVDPNRQQADNRTYGYDAAGRLTDAIADSDPRLNQHFEYDPLDRLTSSQRGEPQLSRTDYQYDLSGNRISKEQNNSVETYSIDPGSNRLQQKTGANINSYSYDQTGNLTGDGTNSYSYNAAGRRIAATAAGQTVSYGYDALGQRISKTVNGATAQYFYDEQGHLTGRYDATGQLVQEIIWLGDLPVAVLKPAATTAATTATDLYYIHADHLGTPRKITRPSDNRVVWSWESEAFGDSLPDQNPSGLGTFVFNLRFPGQYYDAETGLFYNMERYYNSETGGYDTSDPIGLAGGINTYSYVSNNPLRWTDPLGLFVTGNYDSATGQLTLTDQDTGNTVTTQAESGGKPYGDSIPSGTYDILERQGRPDFYRLDKQDSFPFDDVDNVTGRNHFRLHRPGRTIGCIAAKDGQGWKQVDELIQNTKQIDLVPDNFKPWWKFWPTTQQDLRRYGTLTVH